MDPAELAAPLRVLAAVERGERAAAARKEYDAKSTFAFGYDDRHISAESWHAVDDLRVALDSWLALDRRACVALLGPGLGLEQ
jgi:hypothetical protein